MQLQRLHCVIYYVDMVSGIWPPSQHRRPPYKDLASILPNLLLCLSTCASVLKFNFHKLFLENQHGFL